MGKQRPVSHVDLTHEVIVQMASEFEAGSCIPELMERYGWCRNKITKLLREQLGPRYEAIAKKIAQDRRIGGSRKANNARRGFKQTPDWIEKRASKIRGTKWSFSRRVRGSEIARARTYRRSAESYAQGGAKAKETKLRNGVYERHAVLMANLHATGAFDNKGHRYGIKSYFKSAKTGKIERCDSNFERERMKQLDADDRVAFWTKMHGITIKYTKSTGDMHRYVPDFLITFIDGTQVLEELKGRDYDPEVNRLKFEALQAYCQEHGLGAKWTWQKTKDQF